MYETQDRPLIACVTSEKQFCGRIEAAARELGADFCSHEDDPVMTGRDSRNRRQSCLVVDVVNTETAEHPLISEMIAETHVFLAVVPQGNVQLAFQAASAGAITVIEKPLVPNELVVNLRAAFASESRMEAYLRSEQRFSSAFFDCLTDREKSILRLLMDGEPNKRVAALLDIGLRTVEGERAQMIRKLRVSSFVELIKLVASIENDYLRIHKSIFDSILPVEFNHRRVG